MTKFIFNGEENGEFSLVKGSKYEIPVDVIGDVGEYVNKDSVVVEFYDADNRAGSATASITADDLVLTLTDEVTGAGWNLLDHTTTYYAWGVGISGSDEYIGTLSTQIDVI